MDPRSMEEIRNKKLVISAEELCQFNHCCRWMETVIPHFHTKAQLVTEILEKAGKITWKQKKAAIRKFMPSNVS